MLKKVFANGDDSFLIEGLRDFKGEILTFGLNSDCDYRAENINFYDDYLEFDFCTDIASFTVKTSLTGFYNVYNLTGAIAVATFLGISKCMIKNVAELFSPVKMRGEIIKINGIEVFF